jgi:hypothetical protein
MFEVAYRRHDRGELTVGKPENRPSDLFSNDAQDPTHQVSLSGPRRYVERREQLARDLEALRG